MFSGDVYHDASNVAQTTIQSVIRDPGGDTMVGVICKRQVAAHPVVTIRCFGWNVFWHALIAGPNQTFLELVSRYSDSAPPRVNVAKLIDRCIKLEQRANRLYNRLAQRWTHDDRMSSFLRTLADQECTHAELLQLCRKLADKKHWRDADFARWKTALPELEQSMDEVELRAEQLVSIQDILRLVLSIEGSEINRVFLGIIDAIDSAFVRRLKVFRQAEQEHIGFICDQVSQMQPELSDQCRKLRECCYKPKCPLLRSL